MELFLFTTDTNFALKAEKAGIDSVIVDWEHIGKDERQRLYDTETNRDSVEDLYKLSQALKIPVAVRVNKLGENTPAEVNCAIENGARILMLPMARTINDVENFLVMVSRRAKTIIQIETVDLVSRASELSSLNWDYAYIGLNDLMIERGGRTIWEAVLDGTVQKILEPLKGRAYGFGGITVIGGGDPINFVYILHELTRLNCSLSFLRRTFKKEVRDRNLEAEITALRAFIEASSQRGPQARQYDHNRLCDSIRRHIQALSLVDQ
jgi:hypothetical protein